jgi:hypothetical protein
VAIPFPELCCFYRIQECTKNEFVAVGANGALLRWGPTGGFEQQWVIVPIDDTWCNIVTRMNGENVAVGSTGALVRWGASGGREQRFSFVNYWPSDYTWNIMEGTRNEYVAVGSFGQLLRWKRTDGPEQRFKLEPVEPIMSPPALWVSKRGLMTPL